MLTFPGQMISTLSLKTKSSMNDRFCVHFNPLIWQLFYCLHQLSLHIRMQYIRGLCSNILNLHQVWEITQQRKQDKRSDTNHFTKFFFNQCTKTKTPPKFFDYTTIADRDKMVNLGCLEPHSWCGWQYLCTRYECKKYIFCHIQNWTDFWRAWYLFW